MRRFVTTLLLLLPFSAFAAEAQPYRAEWHIALQAGVDYAKVTLRIADGRPVRLVRFEFDPERFHDFQATGELEISDANEVRWEPAAEDASLSYRVRITRERDNKNQGLSYDALMTDTWALFRGDRVTPRMRVTTVEGAVSDTVVRFDIPEAWRVYTGMLLDEADATTNTYRIDDPDRAFDRPVGWIMAGRFGSRSDYVGTTGASYFSVVAPLNSQADRMGWLTLVSLVYPQIEQAFVKVPPKILMVSGDDPLWRGGLSGPNSFYFHSSRRAVSENGTSPLLHELAHVITRISGNRNDDWIAEGIAEYYGIELLYRAGGITAAKRAEILGDLAEWGSEAPRLREPQSTGPVTARAVLVFDALDKEIATLTRQQANLDAVTRLLMEKRRVGLDDLRAAFNAVTGTDSRVLENVE